MGSSWSSWDRVTVHLNQVDSLRTADGRVIPADEDDLRIHPRADPGEPSPLQGRDHEFDRYLAAVDDHRRQLEQAIEELSEQHAWVARASGGGAVGPAWQDTGRVFVWADGRGIHPSRLLDWLRRHAAQLGLPAIRVHDLRHAGATAASRPAWS